AAEVDLVRARVVTDVVGVAGSVGKHRHSRVACAGRMGDARRRGSRDDVSRTNRMLLVAEDADPVAFEDHEELLLRRVAMLGRAQLSGRDPVVVDPGVDGAGGHAEIPTLDVYVATAPLRGLDLVDVDDATRARAGLRQLRLGKLGLHRPLVTAVDVDDRVRDANHAQPREVGVRPFGPDAEGERFDAVLARDEAVRLAVDEVDEAVARADLIRDVVVALVLTLPGQTGAAKDEEDLLVTLAVQRGRALAWIDADPVGANPDRARRAREVGPVAADRTGLAVVAVEVVPVNDVFRHPCDSTPRAPPRRRALGGTARAPLLPGQCRPARLWPPPRPRGG